MIPTRPVTSEPWMPLGQILRLPPRPKISMRVPNFRARLQWSLNNPGADRPWSIYNNGVNLYCEPWNTPAHQMYADYKWQHIPFRYHSNGGRLLTTLTSHIWFHHWGHLLDGSAVFQIGPWNAVFKIPSRHIMFIAGKDNFTYNILQEKFSVNCALVPVV